MKAFFLCILIFTSLLACKTDTNDKKAITNTSTSTIAKPNWSDRKDLRKVKMSELEGELSNWTFLTRGYFSKAVEIKGGDVRTDEIKGQWMKLLDDYRYQFGLNEDVTQFGSWKYDNDNSSIHFTNQSPVGQNSQWKVSAGNDNLVFVGTSMYNNNGTQMKWVRVVPEK